MREHLKGEKVFLANFHSDNLSDVPLPTVIDHFTASKKTACFLSVTPSQSFHIVRVGGDGGVSGLIAAKDAGHLDSTGGFFVFKQEIFRLPQARRGHWCLSRFSG